MKFAQDTAGRNLLTHAAAALFLAAAMGVAAQTPSTPRPQEREPSTDDARKDAQQPRPAVQLDEIRVTGQRGERETGYQPKRASTATKTNAPLIEIPQAVNVVPQQVIIDQGARTLDDVLKNVSGITQSNTYGNTTDGFLKRGFGTNGDGSILRDGVRSYSSRNLSVATDRVEVLKGPASLLYGIQEPGGVINVISKKPLPDFRGEANLIYNSFGGGAGWIDLSTPVAKTDAGQAGLRLIGEHEDADYWRNFGTIRRTLVAPSFSWESERLSVNLSYEYLDFSLPFDRGTAIVNGRPADVPPERRFDEPFNRQWGIAQFALGQIEWRASDRFSVRLSQGWSNEKNDDFQARPRALNPVTGALTRSADGNLGGDYTDTITAVDTISRFAFGPTQHELVLGADYEDRDGFRRDSLGGPPTGGFNIYNPVYGQLAEPSVISNAFSDFRSEIRSRSVYAQDTISFAERWRVVLGARYQDTDQFSGQGRPFIVSDDSSTSKVLPRVGLVYLPRPDFAVYANYSESFLPNAADPLSGNTFKPQEGVVYEGGLKLNLASGVFANLAVYQITKQNVLVSENSVVRAVGEARSRGIELDVSGQIAANLQLIGTYAYTDAETIEDIPANEGKQLTNVARNVASLFLTYQLGSPVSNGRWVVGGGARYVGRRPGDVANTFFLDSYTVADAYARYEWRLMGRLARVQLNVKNVFDETFYPSSGGNLRINVGEPRQFLVTAGLEF